MILVGVHVDNMSTHHHDPSVPSMLETNPEFPANMFACSVECQETSSSHLEKNLWILREEVTQSPPYIFMVGLKSNKAHPRSMQFTQRFCSNSLAWSG